MVAATPALAGDNLPEVLKAIGANSTPCRYHLSVAEPIDSMPFDEFEAELRLSVLTDQEIADWIMRHAPLSDDQERRIVEAVDLAKGDRSPSAILIDAMNVLRRPPSKG
jgi:hypothetical protein